MMLLDRVRQVRVQQTCSQGGMAQYVDVSDGVGNTSTAIMSGGQRGSVPGTPELFYLNGDDVEVLLGHGQDALEDEIGEALLGGLLGLG